jgi:predicted O-methyltransferase YrrM
MSCNASAGESSVLKTLKKLVPASVRHYRHERREKVEFARQSSLPCDATPLRNVRDVDLATTFANATFAAEWLQLEREISKLGITDGAAGVNPGDRRALYYLIRRLCPKTVLEIGTNVGASTAHIVAALRKEPGVGSFRVDTVDIYDVNDPVVGPWATMHSTHPPAELMRALGCAPAVIFHTKDSLDYMSACTRKFDLIFLDGDHAATRVYREVPAALKLLNPGGYILLHDYFPNSQPLWQDGSVVSGPFEAIHRLQNEGAKIEALPLGALPWPTKQNSNVTSLAVLGKA